MDPYPRLDASVNPNDLQQTGDDTAVALAVAAALRDAGPSLVAEPRRVQGMVTDVLGAGSRTRRAEVDAVVLAAEECIPEDLLARSVSSADAVARLQDRGLDTALAAFAVSVWEYALGLLAADQAPPSLTLSASAEVIDLSDGAVAEPTVLRDAVDTRPVDATVLPAYSPAPGSEGSEPTVLPQSAQPLASIDEAPDGRNRVGWVLGAAAALALVALVGFVALRNDSGTDTVETAAPEPEGVKVDFPPESTHLGTVQRTWEVDDATLVSTVVIDNEGDAPTAGRHYEVVPKEVAATADLITSTPEHTVIKADPVVAWDVALEPAASTTVTYRVAVDPATTVEDLETWKDLHTKEAAAFAIEVDTPPALTLENPAGQVVNDPAVDIVGTVRPAGVPVTVNGEAAVQDENGRFVHRVNSLAAGDNTITISATNTFDQSASTQIVVRHDVPAAPVESNEYAEGSLGGDGGSASLGGSGGGSISGGNANRATPVPPGVTPPAAGPAPAAAAPAPAAPAPQGPTTAPPTTAPPNRAPVKRTDPTFDRWDACAYSLDNWYVYVLQVFSDPDGDTMSVVNVNTSVGQAESTGNSVRWYEPWADFTGSARVHFNVSDGRGGVTPGVLTITVHGPLGNC